MRHDFRITQQPLVMIIPMIDIMLFLLVFFMVSTIYMVQSNSVQVNLPAGTAGKADTANHLITITVSGTGDIFYDQEGKPTRDLSDKVHAALAKDPDAVFVLRGDRKTPYESIAQALDVLKSSGTKHVSIALENGK